MFQHSDPHLLRLLVEERHDALRRAAGATRLRRADRRSSPTGRRRHRAGPGR